MIVLLIFLANWVVSVEGYRFSTVEKGVPNTDTYRVYFQNSEKEPVSPFHDIPLMAKEGVYNMVIEIPRWTNSKMEIIKEEKLNPIMQDKKHGKLRYVSNVFPYHGYIWNYGALPQTWEDPSHIDSDTGAGGDNDPVDAIEIGSGIGRTGEVKQVKVLGVLALVDDGETDWKVICIDVKDDLADKLNDIDDIEKLMPGLLEASRDWFRIYKAPTSGNTMNQFGFNGDWQCREFAESMIRDTNKLWKRLMRNEIGEIRTENTKQHGSPGHLTVGEAQSIISEQVKFSLDGPGIPDWVHEGVFVRRTVSEDVCDAVDDDDDDI